MPKSKKLAKTKKRRSTRGKVQIYIGKYVGTYKGRKMYKIAPHKIVAIRSRKTKMRGGDYDSLEDIASADYHDPEDVYSDLSTLFHDEPAVEPVEESAVAVADLPHPVEEVLPEPEEVLPAADQPSVEYVPELEEHDADQPSVEYVPEPGEPSTIAIPISEIGEEHSSSDEEPVAEAEPVISEEDIKSLLIPQKKKRAQSEGNKRWLEYVKEVRSLPRMKGKPNSYIMQEASKLYRMGVITPNH